MLKVLEDLVLIQERDRRLAQLRRDLNGVPSRKEQIRQRLKDREDAFRAADDAWKKETSSVKQIELEIEDAKGRINRFRQQQLEVKNNTEYRTLEHEIGECLKKIRGFEDRELEMWETVEQAKTVMAARKKDLDEEKSHIDQDCAELDQRGERVGREIAELEAERQSRVAGIDPQWLSRYERIMKHRGDAAVVPVDNGSCGGCHMKLPPQGIQDAKRAQDVSACTFCGRILYWKD